MPTTPDQIFDAFCQKEQLGCPAGCQPCGQSAWTRTESELLNRTVAWDRFTVDTVLSKHLRPRGCHGPHVGIVRSHLLNAFAAKDSDWFLIGINRGTYHFLAYVATRMLSDRRVLPNIGDPEKELPTVPGTDLLSMEQSRLDKPLFPRCPVRDEYAHMLYKEMMQFLSLHELAHIVRGHVGYLSSSSGIGQIQELNMALQPGGPLASQAMEAHADMSAAELCFIRSLNAHRLLSEDPNRRIADDVRVDKIRKELYADKALTVLRTSLAIYLLFRAFATDSRATTQLREPELIQGSHPHPLVRQLLLMGQLHLTLLDREQGLVDSSIGYAAIRVAENAISFASGQGECTEIPDDLRNNIGPIQNHIRTLLREIDNVKLHCDQYAWPVEPTP